MFALKYKPDPGLEFLQFCSHEEINELSDILISTGGSSVELSTNSEYIKNKENLSKCWPIVAAELQKFGGNTISNIARIGEGVLYDEIVNDLCLSFEIASQNLSITEKEDEILLKSLSDSFCIKHALKLFNERADQTAGNPGNQTVFMECIRRNSFLAYEVSLEFMDIIKKFAESHESKMKKLWANDTRIPILAPIYAGPLFEILRKKADPAFRVTIPAIIHIAYLRRKKLKANIL